MPKTMDYTTYIPEKNGTIAVTVNFIPKTKNKSKNLRLDNLCSWGKDFGKKQQFSESDVMKAIKKRRYGECY